tara:strand:- start:8069 stop:8509 length:441 start_codon:yes stop_codon:yes gene_type:complete
MESASSGDQIIGNHQLILQRSSDQEEFSYWDTRKEPPTSAFGVGETSNFLTTELTGLLSFTSDFKGYFDIIVEDENIKVYFDWSYDGSKWYLTDSNFDDWIITSSNRCTNNDMIYCDGQSNTSGVYIMTKVGGYRTGDWRYYKLVF